LIDPVGDGVIGSVRNIDAVFGERDIRIEAVIEDGYIFCKVFHGGVPFSNLCTDKYNIGAKRNAVNNFLLKSKKFIYYKNQ
jgi:hypothetical protein